MPTTPTSSPSPKWGGDRLLPLAGAPRPPALLPRTSFGSRSFPCPLPLHCICREGTSAPWPATACLGTCTSPAYLRPHLTVVLTEMQNAYLGPDGSPHWAPVGQQLQWPSFTSLPWKVVRSGGGFAGTTGQSGGRLVQQLWQAHWLLPLNFQPHSGAAVWNSPEALGALDCSSCPHSRTRGQRPESTTLCMCTQE